jgi:hypothetical protein
VFERSGSRALIMVCALKPSGKLIWLVRAGISNFVPALFSRFIVRGGA